MGAYINASNNVVTEEALLPHHTEVPTNDVDCCIIMYQAALESQDDKFWRRVDNYSPTMPELLEQALLEPAFLRTPERSFTNCVASLDTPPKKNQEAPKCPTMPKKKYLMTRCMQQTSTSQKSHINITPHSPLETSVTLIVTLTVTVARPS